MGIVVLVLILVILLLIVGLILYIRAKAKEASLLLFGTEDLKEGFEQIEAEYAATPKSVSAVTSLYLPKIVRDFPEFSVEQMKTRAENVLVSYLQALDQKSTTLPADCTPEFRQQLVLEIQESRNKQTDLQYKEIKLHRTEIAGYKKVPGRCIITFQTALQSKNGTKLVQSKWNTEAIYVQDSQVTDTELDAGLGLNCPNCGAPITTLGKKICEYCGTEVMELNIHIWAFNRVTQIN